MSASEAENLIRDELEKEFGMRLFKNYVQVGMKANGQPKTHQFDIVSQDEEIVAEVKSGKQYDSVRFAECILDCFYLSKVKNAKHRILVLTDRWVYEGFVRDSDGLLEGIEVRLVEFP